MMWILNLACLLSPIYASASETIYGFGNDNSLPTMRNIIFEYYSKTDSNVTIAYNSMPSSDMTCAFEGTCSTMHDEKIDFSISNFPLQSALSSDLQSFPLFVYGIAPIFNLPGVSHLRLTKKALADIFRGCHVETNVHCLPGSITMWNDSQITSVNPSSIRPFLDNAGEIKRIIGASANHATFIFKRALSAFDSSFHDQIGHGNDNSWNGTTGIEFVSREAGVQRRVFQTPGSIGFDSIHNNIAFGSKQIELLVVEDGTIFAVQPTSDSLFAAMHETNQLEDGPFTMINLTGKRSWPISLLAYVSFRTQYKQNDKCKEEKLELISFLEFMYSNMGETSPLFSRGLAPLTVEKATNALSLVKSTTRCELDLVYQPPVAKRLIILQADESFHFMLNVFSSSLQQEFNFNLAINGIENRKSIRDKFLCIANETCSSLTNFGLIVIADESLSLSILADDEARPEYGLSSFPFLAVSTGFIFNSCADPSVACAYRYQTPLVLDIVTAAKMLNLEIVYWDDAAIQTLNPDKLLPHETIRVLSGPRTNSYHLSFISMVQKTYWPTFTYAGGEGQSQARTTYLETYLDVSLTPFSFSFVVFNGTEVNGVSVVSLLNNRGNAVASSTQTIEACALDTYDEAKNLFYMQDSQEANCYPLVMAFNIFIKNPLIRGFTAQICNALYTKTLRSDTFRGETPISMSKLGTLTDLKLNNQVDMQVKNFQVLDDLRYLLTGERILRIPHKLNLISQDLIIGMYVLMSIELFFFAVLAVWVFVNRRRKLVHNSSPVFMYQILFGAAFIVLTIVPLSQQDDYLVPKAMTLLELAKHVDPSLDFACVVSPILFSIGFFMAFSALFLKTWRLIRIFDNRKLRKLFLKDKELLIYQIMVIVVVIVLNAIWAGVDPMVWQRIPGFFNSKNLVISSSGLCVTRGGILPALPLILGILLLLIIGNYLAYLGRRIPTQFNESKWTAVAMVVIMESFIIGIPLLILSNDQPMSGFLVKSIICLLVAGATVALIFVPKLMIAYGWGQTPDEASNPWRFVKESGSSKKVESKLRSHNTSKQDMMVQQQQQSSMNSYMQHQRDQGFTPNSTPNISRADVLSAILKDDPMRRKFRRYLQQMKMEENVRFWDATLEFAAESSETLRSSSARAIIQTFILPGSQFEVNLSSKAREALLEAYKANDKSKLSNVDFFRDATKEIFDDLKQSDAFRHFLGEDTFSMQNLA